MSSSSCGTSPPTPWRSLTPPTRRIPGGSTAWATTSPPTSLWRPRNACYWSPPTPPPSGPSIASRPACPSWGPTPAGSRAAASASSCSGRSSIPPTAWSILPWTPCATAANPPGRPARAVSDPPCSAGTRAFTGTTRPTGWRRSSRQGRTSSSARPPASCNSRRANRSWWARRPRSASLSPAPRPSATSGTSAEPPSRARWGRRWCSPISSSRKPAITSCRCSAPAARPPARPPTSPWCSRCPSPRSLSNSRSARPRWRGPTSS